MAKVNLHQARLSHVSEISHFSLYQKAVNQDMKVLLEWRKKRAILKN